MAWTLQKHSVPRMTVEDALSMVDGVALVFSCSFLFSRVLLVSSCMLMPV